MALIFTNLIILLLLGASKAIVYWRTTKLKLHFGTQDDRDKTKNSTLKILANIVKNEAVSLVFLVLLIALDLLCLHYLFLTPLLIFVFLLKSERNLINIVKLAYRSYYGIVGLVLLGYSIAIILIISFHGLPSSGLSGKGSKEQTNNFLRILGYFCSHVDIQSGQIGKVASFLSWAVMLGIFSAILANLKWLFQHERSTEKPLSSELRGKRIELRRKRIENYVEMLISVECSHDSGAQAK